MTLHPKPLAFIRASLGKRSIWPKVDVPDDVWPKKLGEIGYLIIDIMVLLRAIQNFTGNRVSVQSRFTVESIEDKLFRYAMTVEAKMAEEQGGKENVDNVALCEALAEGLDLEKINSWDTRPMTCEEYVSLLAVLIKKVVNNDGGGISPHTVVLRFDRAEKTRKNKYVQTQRDVEPFVIPGGKHSFRDLFSDQSPMPAQLDTIFYNAKAKRWFYQYLDDYLKYRAFPTLPENKIVIVDGLISSSAVSSQYGENLNGIDGSGWPIKLYWDKKKKKVEWEMMDKSWFHFEAEADLGAPFWLWKLRHNSWLEYNQLVREEANDFPVHLRVFGKNKFLPQPPEKKKEVYVISSDDGDILPTMFLHLSKIATRYCQKNRTKLNRLKEGDILQGDVIFIRKSMKYGEEPYVGVELSRREHINAIRKQKDPKAHLMRLKKTLKQVYYISAEGLTLDLLLSRIDGSVPGQLWYGSTKDCPHPLEVFSAFCFAAGCDYVMSLPYVDFGKMMEVFMENTETFGKMVTKQRLTHLQTPTFDSEFDDDANCPYTYRIDTRLFILMITICMKSKFKKAVDKACDLFGIMDEANVRLDHLLSTDPETPNSKVTLIGACYNGPSYSGYRNGNVTLENIYTRLACIAWTLAYFGNGSIDGWKVQDPFALDEYGLPLYGFELIEKDKPAGAGNVRYAEQVTISDYYECC